MTTVIAGKMEMVRAKEIIIEEGSISVGYPKCIVVVEAMRSTRMS